MEPKVRTDRIVSNNKLDSTIRVNKQGTCVLIHAAISANRNVIKTKLEKYLKYKDRKIKIERMWNVKPIITGQT